MYNRLGKAAVRFAFRYLRRRYRREIRIGARGRRAGASASLAYLATRNVREG